MGDGTSTVTGLFAALIKFLLTIGGAILIVVGIFTGNWPLAGVGIGAIAVGQMVHFVDQIFADKQLERWAADAVVGIGPVPPRPVRLHLARTVTAERGIGGDIRAGYYTACRTWASEHSTDG